MPGLAIAVRSRIAFLARSVIGLRRRSTAVERGERLLLGLGALELVLEL